MARKTTTMGGGPLALGVALVGGCSYFTPPTTPPADAGPSLNNCTASLYADHTAVSADRTVTFGGMGTSPPFGFSPPCMTVAVGQSVTFSGTFSAHPLAPGTGPAGMTAGSPGNPIVNTTDGTAVSFTFPAAGMYPYYCQMHYAAGMLGVVQVQ